MSPGRFRSLQFGLNATFGVVVLSALTACSGLPSGTKTVTVTASGANTSAPAATLAYPTAEASSEASSSTAGTSETPAPEISTGPPVLRNPGAPKSLTLADIFKHSNWEEGLYQTPQSATPAQAMGIELGCNPAEMEIRFAQATGKATVKVAQALDSYSSKVTLEFKLTADERLVDTKLVKFNQESTLNASLNGVSALTLKVGPAQGSKCNATAVITEFLITPS